MEMTALFVLLSVVWFLAGIKVGQWMVKRHIVEAEEDDDDDLEDEEEEDE